MRSFKKTIAFGRLTLPPSSRGWVVLPTHFYALLIHMKIGVLFYKSRIDNPAGISVRNFSQDG